MSVHSFHCDRACGAAENGRQQPKGLAPKPALRARMTDGGQFIRPQRADTGLPAEVR